MMSTKFKKRWIQTGIALPVVLIFLIVMMLLGVTAIRNVTLGEKVAGNQRNQQLAFRAAEQALRFCENQLQTTPIGVPLIQPATTGPEDWEVDNNWKGTNNGISTEIISINDANKQGLVAPPRCMVEDVSKTLALDVGEEVRDKTVRAYRITARASGGADTAVVILQSYLKF